MARIRSIKPEFWSSEQVMECSPTARLLFIGLWNFCDDAGRHPVTPKQLRALIFPGDDFTSDEIARMLDELSTNGLVEFYTVDGKRYLQVTGWSHQKIDRPQKPKHPGPLDEHSTNARDGKDKGRDKGKDTEANASGAAAPVVPIDAKTALFREGLDTLSAITGRPQSSLRSIVGRWVSRSGNDHASVLALIRQARDQAVIDAVSWIEKSMRPRDPDAEIYRNVL